jgi:hypothetical protein
LNTFNLNARSESEQDEMYTVDSYLAYLAISICATVMVARTLYKNGRVFLVDAFHGNADIADSVNHLPVAGFYLLNIGYITLAVGSSVAIGSAREAIELICQKAGFALMVLGGIHLFNLYVLNRMRRNGRASAPAPAL